MAARSASRMSLERIIGLTTIHNASLCINRITGDVLYAAGCIVVVYNPTQNKQTQFLRARQPICSIAVSPDGCLVAAGQRGKTAPVTVWNAATGTVVWELSHHSAGVAALAFSPDGRCLVSCGFRVDKALSVWDVATGRRVGSGKLSQKVTSLTFAESGGRFVTAGERHLKFWSLGSLLEDSASSASARALGGQGSDGPVPLTSKAAGMRESGPEFESFVDVCAGRGAQAQLTFAVTTAGILCCFDADRLLAQWVNTRVRAGFALDVTPERVFVGGSDGIVRCFDAATLEFLSTLPLPAAVGRLGVSQGQPVPPPRPLDVFPGAVCLRAASSGGQVVVVYGDASLYVWECSRLSEVSKLRSSCAHSGAISGVAVLPVLPEGQAASGPDGLPPGTFVTCSADSTVRFWNLNPRALPAVARLPRAAADEDPSAASGQAAPARHLRRNMYTREQMLIVYVDQAELTPAPGGAVAAAPSGAAAPPSAPAAGAAADACFPAGSWPTRTMLNATLDLEPVTAKPPVLDAGLRCLAVSPRGDLVAVGDRVGYLRVFALPSGRLQWLEAAHDEEVLCLRFNSPALAGGDPQQLLLASGSRDKFLHVFAESAAGSFDVATTVTGHSSSVASVVFSADGQGIISAGSYASLLSTRLAPAPPPASGGLTATQVRLVETPHERIYDMTADPTGRNLVVVGRDARVHVYLQRTCKLLRSFKPATPHGDETPQREVNRVVFDPTGLFVACASFDHVVRIFDFFSGDCVAHVSGHAELVTGLAFTLDLKRLITVGGDGLIMVWRLGSQLARAMADRWAEIEGPRPVTGMLVQLPPPPLPPARYAEGVAPSNTETTQTLPASTPAAFAAEDAAPAAVSSDPGAPSPPLEFRTSILPSWAQALVTGAAGSTTPAVDAAGCPSTEPAASQPPPESAGVPAAAFAVAPPARASKWAHIAPTPVPTLATPAQEQVVRGGPETQSPTVSETAAAVGFGATHFSASLQVSDGEEEEEDFEEDFDDEEGGAGGSGGGASAEYPPDFHQPVEQTPATAESFNVTRSAIFERPIAAAAVASAAVASAAVASAAVAFPAAPREGPAVSVARSASQSSEDTDGVIAVKDAGLPDDVGAPEEVALPVASPSGATLLAPEAPGLAAALEAAAGAVVVMSSASAPAADTTASEPLLLRFPPLASIVGAVERLEASIAEVSGLLGLLGGAPVDLSFMPQGDQRSGSLSDSLLSSALLPGSASSLSQSFAARTGAVLRSAQTTSDSAIPITADAATIGEALRDAVRVASASLAGLVATSGRYP